MRRPLLIGLIITAALAAFVIIGLRWYNNRISFPEQEIELRCPLIAPRFERGPGNIDYWTQSDIVVRETGCADGLFVRGDIYGYDQVTGKLLYISQNPLTNITYFVKPTPLSLDAGLIQECGYRTIVHTNFPFSRTYAFPCTDEFGLLPVPEQEVVNLTGYLVDPDQRFHYDVVYSVGDMMEMTMTRVSVERTDQGSWYIVNKD